MESLCLGYPDMVFWWRVQRSDACPSACLGGVRRVLQITELVRDCLQQRDANCSITPAPPESCSDDSAAALLQARAGHPQQHCCLVYVTSGRAIDTRSNAIWVLVG